MVRKTVPFPNPTKRPTRCWNLRQASADVELRPPKDGVEDSAVLGTMLPLNRKHDAFKRSQTPPKKYWKEGKHERSQRVQQHTNQGSHRMVTPYPCRFKYHLLASTQKV